jgi:ABC-type thiamine transport system ATPase subunit
LVTERQVVDLGSLLDTMVHAGHPPATKELAQMAETLGKMFGVDPDEVAILALSPKSKSLKFVIPEKLSFVGTIPLTSTNALAARTARERRSEVVNNFNASRHATVFEAMALGRRPGETIQKIMSAPILDATKVVGVVQISRKGRSPVDAGPDFTQRDLRALISLSPTLEMFLKLCQVE